jgi:Zn-dependent M28 family amino/carboxypeptidase
MQKNVIGRIVGRRLAAVASLFLMALVATGGAAHTPDARTRTERFVERIEIMRYLKSVETLANFKSRYTTSPGCRAAAEYLASHFSSLGLKVSRQPFRIGPGRAENVIAVLPGANDPTGVGEFLLIGAHYDSIAQDADRLKLAPGAEDNASGTAALMELARLFHDQKLRMTIVFAAFAGEEQGLVGSRAYVAELKKSGRADRLKAALIMDMIGFTKDAELDLTFETLEKFKPLAESATQAAKRYAALTTTISLNPFGSDHVPFLDADLPAFLVIESDWDKYPAYHKSTDVPKNVSPDMAREALKLVAAWTFEAANSTP